MPPNICGCKLMNCNFFRLTRLIIFSWPVGTFIGVGLVQAARNEIRGMTEAMQKIQAIMDEYEAKQRTASRLELNISFVNVSDQTLKITHRTNQDIYLEPSK